jgi:hypothetical protein
LAGIERPDFQAVVVEGGAVAMQQQEELAVQKEELGQPAVGDQQNLVEVDDVDDPEARPI